MKAAVDTTPFVWLIGCTVIAGGMFVTARLAIELVTEPDRFVMVTV